MAAQRLALNPEQAGVVGTLATDAAAGGFGVALLHGVTGSGKTEIYLRSIEAALEAGGGVIYLVPEVALTPQTVARLRARLAAMNPPRRCIVWHSHLGEGERLDGWLALRRPSGARPMPSSGPARPSSPRSGTSGSSSSTRSTSRPTSRTRPRAITGATSR